MNWKNVLYLLQVERKSGRLIRGIKATRYRENSFIAYWPYWIAAIIGCMLEVCWRTILLSIVYSKRNSSRLTTFKCSSSRLFLCIADSCFRYQYSIYVFPANPVSG